MKVLKQMGSKIFIELEVIPVYDHIHIVQCYHCQEHEHYAGSLKCKYRSEDYGFCFYCSSRHHKSSKCTLNDDSTKHKCSNCVRTKADNPNHKATDPLRPSVIRETQLTIARTSGLEDAKNEYEPRIERLEMQRRMV